MPSCRLSILRSITLYNTKKNSRTISCVLGWLGVAEHESKVSFFVSGLKFLKNYFFVIAIILHLMQIVAYTVNAS